jgi:hypothetical protein
VQTVENINANTRHLTMNNVKQFEVGKSYATRSIVNSDHWVRITVAKRTAKFLTTTEGKRLGISIYNGVEQVKPWGSYSMCPIVGADDEGRGEQAAPAPVEAATAAKFAEPTCDKGGTRHVYLGGFRCTLCGRPNLRVVA